MTDNHYKIAAVEHADMIEGSARVVEADRRMVWLEAETRSACGGCSASKTCGISSLSKALGRKNVRFRLPNDFDGRVGEWVVVGIPQSSLLRASVIAYLLPVIGMVGMAMVSSRFAVGDGATVVAALVGLGLGLIGAGQYSRWAVRGDHLQPVYLRRGGLETALSVDCGVGSPGPGKAASSSSS